MSDADPWSDLDFMARSPTVAMTVSRLIHPTFDTIEGFPFFRGPDWEGQATEFEVFVRRQLRHHRWQSRKGAELHQLFAGLAEVDVSECFNSFLFESDRDDEVLNALGTTMQKTWANALDQQYGSGSYGVTLIPVADESPEGPFLRYVRSP